MTLDGTQDNAEKFLFAYFIYNDLTIYENQRPCILV